MRSYLSLVSSYGVFALLALAFSLSACGSSKEQTKVEDKAAAEKKTEAAAQDQGPVQVVNDGNTSVERIDVNGDKKPDVFKFYRIVSAGDKDGKGATKVLIRKEMDVNFDQKFDIVQYYTGEPGQEILVREEMDLDFDGRVDSTRHYKEGHVSLVELDLGFDGKTDTWRYYQLTKNDDGKTVNRLIEKRRDRDGDGAVDVWEYYTKGRLTKVGYDTTGDGKPDRFQKTGVK